MDILKVASTYPRWILGSLLFVDEIQEYVMGKRTMSQSAVDAETFASFIRKLDCDVLTTCQFPKRLTRAFRDQVDFFVMPRLIRTPGGLLGAKLFWFDWNGVVTGRAHNARNWPPLEHEADDEYTIWGLEQMFNHYDTNQIVVGPHVKNRKALIQTVETYHLRRVVGQRIFQGADALPQRELFNRLVDHQFDGKHPAPEEYASLLGFLNIDISDSDGLARLN